MSTLRVTSALVLREMATTHGRSAGGYLWALLEPIVGIALMTFIFSIGFRAPALGTNFPIFFATGILPYILFSDIAAKVASALLFSKQLLVYPRVTFVDALLGRFILNLLTNLMVSYVLIAGMMMLMETRVVLKLDTIALAYLLTAFLGLGVGTFNAYAFTRFPSLQRVWSIVTRPLFLISGVFFIPEIVPQPYRDYMLYNPLAHLISLMRKGFYPSYDAPYISITFICIVSGVTLVLGLLFLKRYYRDLLNL